MAAILLQNMVAISSRARTRAVWISAATSARFFSGAYRRRSAASVTRASPAKWATLAGGTPASHVSAAPRESSQARCLRWSLNRCTDAAGATVLSRSKSLRRRTGSTSSSPSITCASAGVIRAAMPANTAVLTCARMLAASSSRVL
jgi:hypothetical protein